LIIASAGKNQKAGANGLIRRLLPTTRNPIFGTGQSKFPVIAATWVQSSPFFYTWL
jgi:hypothetical protein